MNKKYRVVSLFSGVGGFEQGFNLSDLDYEVLFSSEIDKYAQITYNQIFPNKELVGDIKEVPSEDIPDHDILCAGFPCQAFSIAGKREGFEDTRGTLFFEVARILDKKRPKYVILENVKNLISHDKSETIKRIIKTLSDLGYSVDFTILNSKKFGVPQNRERVYILGILGKPVVKYEINSSNKTINSLKTFFSNSGVRTFNFFNKIEYSMNMKYIKDIIENSVDEKYFYDTESIKGYLADKKDIDRVERKNEIIKLFDLPREIHNDLERQRRIYSIYGISPTLLARSDTTKIFIEGSNRHRIRKTTPYENFLIQGFPRSYVERLKTLELSDAQLYKQAGNAVSPPVIKEILNKLIDGNPENLQYTFIDLFSGLGGFRIAFESCGAKCVFSSEIDTHARKIYYNNFGEIPSGDVTKIAAEDVPTHDILCAGFPCQPFSLAGKRLGFEDTRGTLFFEIVRIIKEKLPKAIFLENVAGIVNHDGGRTLSVIEKEIKGLGYKIKWKIMNACNYGVPQNRNRWYMVGIREDLCISDEDLVDIFPEEIILETTLSDILDLHKKESFYAISKIAQKNINLFKEQFKTMNKRYNADKILIANEVRPSRCNFRSDGISPCLTAKMGTGGNNIPIIVDAKRRFTEEECLRIMGFPEWYKIEKNKMQSYKQIGNSVAVPVIKKIGERIIKFLGKNV